MKAVAYSLKDSEWLSLLISLFQPGRGFSDFQRVSEAPG